MSGRFLQNGEFKGIKEQLQTPPSMSFLCKNWQIEWNRLPEPPHVSIRPLETVPEASGLTLQSKKSKGWFRIWQEIVLHRLEQQRRVRLCLKARRTPGCAKAPTLEWIALLRTKEATKRTFARKLIGTPTTFAENWSEIVIDLDLNDLASETTYFFVMQFSGEDGSVDLQSVAFEQLPFPDGRTTGSLFQQLSEGGIARLEKGILYGWSKIPAGHPEVLLVIDGHPVATVEAKGISREQAGGDTNLLTYGFAWNVPTTLMDGNKHTISLRDPTTGKQLHQTVLHLSATPLSAVESRASAVSSIGNFPSRPVAQKKGNPEVEKLAASIPTKRKRVCVVSWDMGHNPVGRAFLLADMAAEQHDVELIGPMFPKYGNRIWPPIANSDMSMRTFSASDMKSFLEGAKAIAQTVTCDVVHVGKARLPGIILGALIKRHNDCPMVIDVDDHELSFFANRTPAEFEDVLAAAESTPAEIDIPYSEIWTRYSETLIAESDGVTVSNYSLQERFGGLVVRHGRDERIFDPKYYDRCAARAAFGYNDRDRVVLFLGTPRPHKGVFQIADAMERIGDDRLAFCIIGSINDKHVASRFAHYKRARIALHPDQPWERLPELVSMADAVFLLQDPTSPISEYQIPAKLTDTLALGVPVYATHVPPLADLIAAKVISPIENDADLEEALRNIATGGRSQKQVKKARDYYMSELSYTVNAARMDLAFRNATVSKRDTIPKIDRLFSYLERRTGVSLPRFEQNLSAPAIWQATPPDLVFLWKQNDSDIYGRRSDMMAKYLVNSGKVRRIIHFDAPISSTELDRHAQHGSDAFAHQGNLVYVNTVKRVLRAADSPQIIRRTFVYRAGSHPERFLGTDLPPKAAYSDFLENTLAELNVSKNPLLWVCPVVFDYSDIKAAINPGYVVADIIDDQRRWQNKAAYKARLVEAYNTILRDADLVVANCEAVRKGFSDLRSDIIVVPNGAEIFDPDVPVPMPAELACLPRPIIGYVGNLRDRVDLELIRKVALQYPNGSIVLIGSAHDRPEVLALRDIPNIHLLGVRPYNEAVKFIKNFDVAMMPHIDNELTENMNPLKLYVYFALGVPIVTTQVANIGDISPFAAVAVSHQDFLSKINDILVGRRQSISNEKRKELLQAVSWETRVANIISAIGF